MTSEFASIGLGFGWNRWSTAWLYDTLGLFADYRVRYLSRA